MDATSESDNFMMFSVMSLYRNSLFDSAVIFSPWIIWLRVTRRRDFISPSSLVLSDSIPNVVAEFAVCTESRLLHSVDSIAVENQSESRDGHGQENNLDETQQLTCVSVQFCLFESDFVVVFVLSAPIAFLLIAISIGASANRQLFGPHILVRVEREGWKRR